LTYYKVVAHRIYFYLFFKISLFIEPPNLTQRTFFRLIEDKKSWAVPCPRCPRRSSAKSANTSPTITRRNTNINETIFWNTLVLTKILTHYITGISHSFGGNMNNICLVCSTHKTFWEPPFPKYKELLFVRERG
jgi:hypothetical protein